ncbi:MAG: hypothetical protein MUP85_22085, partial [Candidatus Lokiarchaeota archaeon]|nr:hypothetical protein [Candidatus Lokiarchaeota archaeon]
EIEATLLNPSIDLSELTRPRFNQILKDLFNKKGWKSQPQVFNQNRIVKSFIRKIFFRNNLFHWGKIYEIH